MNHMHFQQYIWTTRPMRYAGCFKRLLPLLLSYLTICLHLWWPAVTVISIQGNEMSTLISHFWPMWFIIYTYETLICDYIFRMELEFSKFDMRFYIWHALITKTQNLKRKNFCEYWEGKFWYRMPKNIQHYCIYNYIKRATYCSIMVKTLRYKLEGCGFETRWGDFFQCT
jgi:hypothetical protein